MEIQSENGWKCFLTISHYPCRGIDDRTDLIKSKNYISMVRFHLGNSSKLKYTRVHYNLRHATLHLFRSCIKRKMTKHFNNDIAFNAHVPHYTLEKPKQRKTVDAWTAIFKSRSQLLKDSLDTQNTRRVLGETILCRLKASKLTTPHRPKAQ